MTGAPHAVSTNAMVRSMTNQFTTYAHVVISQKLIEHVRSLYFLSVAQFLGNTDGQIETLNVASDHALPAYVSAVAAVEAYVNEFLISGAGIDFPQSPLSRLRPEWLERIDIREKLIIIPELLFRQSLGRGTQPLQDFSTL